MRLLKALPEADTSASEGPDTAVLLITYNLLLLYRSLTPYALSLPPSTFYLPPSIVSLLQ